jgi:hypothetical protein
MEMDRVGHTRGVNPVQLVMNVSMLTILLVGAAAQMPPVPDPRKPTPYFSWDTVPIAFHGANRSGVYNGACLRAASLVVQLLRTVLQRVLIRHTVLIESLHCTTLTPHESERMSTRALGLVVC